MRYRPPMSGAVRVSTGVVYPEGASLVVRAGLRRVPRGPARSRCCHTGVSPAQPARAAISPIRVSASAGDGSPKSR